LTILGIVVIIIAGVFYTNLQPSNISKTQTQQLINLATAHADFKVFENLTELENGADVIVQARFTGDRQIKDFAQNGTVIDSAALSSVKITKVYKGNIQTGSTIPVYEPGFIRNNSVYENTEGYKNMNTNGKYILFLRHNPDNTFVGLGVYQGKYDLDITAMAKKEVQTNMTPTEFEKLDYVGENPEIFNKMKVEVLNKYKN